MNYKYCFILDTIEKRINNLEMKNLKKMKEMDNLKIEKINRINEINNNINRIDKTIKITKNDLKRIQIIENIKIKLDILNYKIETLIKNKEILIKEYNNIEIYFENKIKNLKNEMKIEKELIEKLKKIKITSINNKYKKYKPLLEKIIE